MTKRIDDRKVVLMERISALDQLETVEALMRQLDELEFKRRFPDAVVGIQPHRSIDEIAAAQGYTGFDAAKFSAAVKLLDFGNNVDDFFKDIEE